MCRITTLIVSVKLLAAEVHLMSNIKLYCYTKTHLGLKWTKILNLVLRFPDDKSLICTRRSNKMRLECNISNEIRKS